MTFTRAIVFDAVRRLRGGKEWTPSDIATLDRAIDRALGIAETVRRIGPRGLALIKQSEGLRLQAYKCPAGVPTIGYGSTGPHVKMGFTLTETEAEAMLLEDLDRFERGVASTAGHMTPGQFSALVSFSFNVGLKALQDSTLLRLHNAGKYTEAVEQFARWNRAGSKVLPGLTKRRAAEAKLYGAQS